MTKRQFVTICFRMFAVYLALGALSNIPYIYYNAYASLSPLGGSSIFGNIMPIVLFGLSFFWPWLFWKKSDYLMLKVFGDKDFFIDPNGQSQSDELDDKSVRFGFTSDETLQLGLTLFGCWLTANALMPSLTFIISLISTDLREYYFFASNGFSKLLRGATDSIGQLMIGYILIRNSIAITTWINKVRTKNL